MSRQKLILLIVIGAAVGAFFAFDVGQYLSLGYLKQRQADFTALYAANAWHVIALYFGGYVLVTALSLPGAVIMTLAGGAIFGLWVGTVVVSFASSVGATLAFLVSRYVLRDSVQGRFGTRLAEINRGVEKDGAFYLFTLRLVPLVPFFMINLLMGLTRMRAGIFYLVSQVGMLAGTVVFVNAGTQLAKLDSLRGVLSPALLGSFVLLGIFPLLARHLLAFIQRRKVYARWAAVKPQHYDRNLIVIGAGAAGLVSSYIAAAVKAKVTLIEHHKMGGDCLNYGCVPSKALIKTATVLKQIRESRKYGIASAEASFDFAEVMERVAHIIKTVAPHDSVARYTSLGVDCVQGYARIVNPWTVEIDRGATGKQTLTTRSIVIATGAEPFVPPLPGMEEAGFLTSDTLWKLRELPKRLVVLGGGPIGCELAQCFARLGALVTQVQQRSQLLPREDADAAEIALSALRQDGVTVLLGQRAVRCERIGEQWHLVVESQGKEQQLIPFDCLLCAVGRVARLKGFGLEELGIPTDRTVETNEYLETIYPNILAAGDVAGPYQFTHTAAHQAWYAAVNGLFGTFKKFKADYAVVPWTTFIDPEVARVGLSEQEASTQQIPVEVTKYGIEDLDRAIADSSAQGFVKVLTVPGKDRILGVTIVGTHAGDLLAEFVLAMRHGLGLKKILGTIHTYPTLAEANKYVAGEWQRNHQPHIVLKWLTKYHAWRRG